MGSALEPFKIVTILDASIEIRRCSSLHGAALSFSFLRYLAQTTSEGNVFTW